MNLSPEFWISFWTWLFVGSLVVFAGLAIAVTIGGFFDVKALFARIEAQHREKIETTASGEDKPS